MTSPLHGAASPHSCSGRTKDEVLASFDIYLAKSMAGDIPAETREQRMMRHYNAWKAECLNRNNLAAASRPEPYSGPVNITPEPENWYSGTWTSNWRGD